LKTGGFYEHVPKQRLFPTVNDAVTFALNKMQLSTQSPGSVAGRKARDIEHSFSEIVENCVI
jgi:hypothetical protein